MYYVTYTVCGSNVVIKDLTYGEAKRALGYAMRMIKEVRESYERAAAAGVDANALFIKLS